MNTPIIETYNRAHWVKASKPSAMEEMLSISGRSDVAFFSLGMPDASCFPTREYEEICSNLLSGGSQIMQYCPPLETLKSSIVKLMSKRHVSCRENDVFCTSGAQQGLRMVAMLLSNPGDTVFLDEISYPGMIQVCQQLALDIKTIPVSSSTGTDLGALEEMLIQGIKPAFMYVISDGHNPLGVNMSVTKKKKLAQLSNDYGFAIVEDDPYGFLQYGDGATPPIYSYNPERVFYIGSFSKLLSPALRCGWILYPECFASHLSSLKESSDINTVPFNHYIIDSFLSSYNVAEYTGGIVSKYKDRRDMMLASLERYMPECVEYVVPTCGFFIWLNIKKKIDTDELLSLAVIDKLTFIPSSAFSARAENKMTNGLRLSFSCCDMALMDLGIRRLAKLISTSV
jgi:2-aminoadipate transaminase